MTDLNLAREFVKTARSVFQTHKEMAERAVTQLPDEELRVALCSHTNSITIVMKHIAGNLRSRWTDFLTSDGEKGWRDRDTEFTDTFANREEIMAFWKRGWNCVFECLDTLRDEDLSKTVVIRGQPHSVPLAIQRSLGHTCYHVGQIVQLARHLAGDQWETLSIPKGQSQEYNRANWGDARPNG